jgi:hypothetical protein
VLTLAAMAVYYLRSRRARDTPAGTLVAVET